MLLAQIEAGLSVVDKAAAASDRWLFLLALAIIIFGGVAVILAGSVIASLALPKPGAAKPPAA